MRIGIVKVNSNPYVEQAVRQLGYTPTFLQIHQEDLVDKIKESPIRKWIFTGTNLAVSVHNPIAPVVPLAIFDMKEKEFLLICYSMESVLFQMGMPVVERKTPKKEYFFMGPLRLYRHHRFYTPVEKVKKQITILNSFRGELMTAAYKNAVMTQWHPERTKDGIQCLKEWIDF